MQLIPKGDITTGASNENPYHKNIKCIHLKRNGYKIGNVKETCIIAKCIESNFTMYDFYFLK